MSNKKTAVVIGITTVLLVALYSEQGQAQDEPEAPETWGKYHAGWGYEWMAASVALNPDGSVSSRVPANSRERFEIKIANFERRFGSAAGHGLKEGQVAPEKFCTPESTIEWGYRVGRHIGSILLLSEVAVKATIKSVALGFGTGASPKALIQLTDVAPLTSRSPVPEYAVLSLGQLVVGDRVFCAPRGPLAAGQWLGPYQPTVGSQIVLIGAWRDGTVYFDEGETGWYAELKDGELNWQFGYEGRTLEELRVRIDQMERGGLFEYTDHLARPGADEMERTEFERSWRGVVESGCRPMGFHERGADGKLTCAIEQ